MKFSNAFFKDYELGKDYLFVKWKVLPVIMNIERRTTHEIKHLLIHDSATIIYIHLSASKWIARDKIPLF